MELARPLCPVGLLPEYWERAETSTWTELDANLKRQYKEYFARSGDLNTYNDVQLELLHARQLVRAEVPVDDLAPRAVGADALAVCSCSDEPVQGSGHVLFAVTNYP